MPVKINQATIFSVFFLCSLLSALFYVGSNTWFFAASYIFIILNMAVVFKQRYNQSINIPVNGILISSLLLLIWFAISIFPSQVKYLSIYNFFWVGSIIIIFILFLFNQDKNKIWAYTYPGILLIVTIWAIYGLVQYYILKVPTNATFLNRNSLAALINLVLIPTAGYFLLNQKQRAWKVLSNKLLTALLFILLLSIFIITSRGASLSLAIGFVLLFVLLRKDIDKAQLKIFFSIAIIAFLISTLSQYLVPHSSQGFTERILSLKEPTQAGNSRLIIWQSLVPLFKEMPWYGLGLGSLWLFWPPYRPATDNSAGFFAHNDYMQILLEAGYPGFLLLIILLIIIVKIFITVFKSFSYNNEINKQHRVEIVALFSSLSSYAVHSLFTYNFYILPLLIISGFYIGRFYQLTSSNFTISRKIPSLNRYFKPVTYVISTLGIVLILITYFSSISLSSYYNNQAKILMNKGELQLSDIYFIRAQKLAPMMDNPLFSHADLLRRASEQLLSVNKQQQANQLIELAHAKLDKADQLNPLRPQTHHIRGLIYYRSNNERAKKEFAKALKLDPRFIVSRIKLAELYHDDNLKEALKILYEGVEYNYPVSSAMLTYMTVFARYCREAGLDSFASHLENNIKRFKQTHLNETTILQGTS